MFRYNAEQHQVIIWLEQTQNRASTERQRKKRSLYPFDVLVNRTAFLNISYAPEKFGME